MYLSSASSILQINYKYTVSIIYHAFFTNTWNGLQVYLWHIPSTPQPLRMKFNKYALCTITILSHNCFISQKSLIDKILINNFEISVNIFLGPGQEKWILKYTTILLLYYKSYKFRPKLGVNTFSKYFMVHSLGNCIHPS